MATLTSGRTATTHKVSRPPRDCSGHTRGPDQFQTQSGFGCTPTSATTTRSSSSTAMARAIQRIPQYDGHPCTAPSRHQVQPCELHVLRVRRHVPHHRGILCTHGTRPQAGSPPYQMGYWYEMPDMQPGIPRIQPTGEAPPCLPSLRRSMENSYTIT